MSPVPWGAIKRRLARIGWATLVVLGLGGGGLARSCEHSSCDFEGVVDDLGPNPSEGCIHDDAGDFFP